MPYVMKIVGCVNHLHTAFDGKFVKAYDPTVHLLSGKYDGGLLEFTDDIRQAMKFESPGDALEKWRQPAGCKCHGTRPWDGKPNRPLTAWHVEVCDVEVFLCK